MLLCRELLIRRLLKYEAVRGEPFDELRRALSNHERRYVAFPAACEVPGFGLHASADQGFQVVEPLLARL